MGRYYNFSDGQEGKFWFACQPTGDVCEFGGQDSQGNYINWEWSKDDLPEINRVLSLTSGELKLTTPYTYNSFMRKMRKNGYLGSSEDKETQSKMYHRASELCAKINLGLKIRRGVRRLTDGEYLSVEAEC